MGLLTNSPEVKETDLILGAGETYTSITEHISDVVLKNKTPLEWFVLAAPAALLAGGIPYVMYLLLFHGIGVWGPNVPVGWGLGIINFVWWIGIGHAGTLISAILLLLRQDWRNSINRFAEAMTIFAVMCAGLYPLFHTGRPWLAYWMLPIPNSMGLWPQPRSPLIMDVFAVSTYATVSIVFWFVGLIPDLATFRDRAQGRFAKSIYGLLCMGWRGSAQHWDRYETAYLLLAGLATPLVLSVHSIVSFDFSLGIIPGWHTTVFPPYFVAGAVFGGFAMVLTLGIPIRRIYHLEHLITMKHIENMCKVMLTTGIIVGYGYMLELFMGWYSANEFEKFVMFNTRMQGPLAWSYWSLIFCNILAPQVLWSKRARRNMLVVWIVANIISVGMWLERFVIIVVSLHRDFVPASWGSYVPTRYDWGFYIGTLGFFTMMMMLFVRALPMIAIAEIKVLADPKPGKLPPDELTALHVEGAHGD